MVYEIQRGLMLVTRKLRASLPCPIADALMLRTDRCAAGDMVANQSEAGDSEIFQLEWAQAAGVSPGGGALDGSGGRAGGKWRIRTGQDKLWRPAAESAGVGVQATSAECAGVH